MAASIAVWRGISISNDGYRQTEAILAEELKVRTKVRAADGAYGNPDFVEVNTVCFGESWEQESLGVAFYEYSR